MMQGDAPAIQRLGVPPYHYGYEALHGLIQQCPFPDRCFTNFPCSSASVASFNRTLWHMTGSAQIDEVRAMYNTQHTGAQGVVSGLHVRGPQLNPQRDPRWGACVPFCGDPLRHSLTHTHTLDPSPLCLSL